MGEQPEAGGTAGGGAAAVLPASEKQQLDSEGEGEEEPLLLERRYGTTGFAHASAFSKTTYTFVSPLLALGAKEQIGEDSAHGYLPVADTAEVLSARFDAMFARVKAESPGASASGLLWRTYWRLYRWRIAGQLAWNVGEIGARVGAPLVLRQLLSWLTGWEATGGDPQAYPVWRGWMWAGILALFAYIYAIVHHQLFWYGMRMGFDMRQQAVAAVQAKVLRLNSVAVADQTAGKIVNLVSSDVRRFDDVGPFWVFLIGGPLELAIVFALVGLRLGWLASLAGVATQMALIPTQASQLAPARRGALVRYIGRLRASTAAQTDERVRLTGEVVSGVLATKMLGWEGPFMEQIRGIRAREAGFIRRAARIRAFNMGLAFAISPLSALAAFGVARATNAGDLTVPNVFYSLALLSLPQLYMTSFFVLGVQFTSELRITMRRLGAFLCLPEPPEPWHAQQAARGAPGGGQPRSPKHASSIGGGGAAGNGLAATNGHAAAAEGKEGQGVVGAAAKGELPAVEVAGADFDWADRSWAEQAGAPAQPAAADAPTPAGSQGPAAAEDGAPAAPQAQAFQLRGLRFAVPRGQLVGIVGAVGCGKSSVLAALLGELQPSRQPGSSGGQQRGRQPIAVRGSVAYCSQVPWVVSGTVKDNILFGQRYDAERFAAVIKACALEDDIAALPAGSDTELGERGINLSGGQKARLALARAAYSGADIQLLDDPLSAVDPRVGRVLFDDCIASTGLMAGSTRLLVTHQRQFLPGCDAVLVLRDGQIACSGTYAELSAAGVPEVVATHETALDDSTYDAHAPPAAAAPGTEDGEAPSTAAPEPSEEDAGQGDSPRSSNEPEAGSGSGGGSSGQKPAAAAGAEQPPARPSRFDRLVSSVFAQHEASARSGSSFASASASGRASSRKGAGALRAASSRWRRTGLGRLTSGYMRRAVSARFGGKPGEDDEEGEREREEEEGRAGGGGAKPAPAPGKSGRLIVSEDRAVGSVPWKVYGQLALRMGLPLTLLIAAGLVAGQAIMLFGDYWLGLWASKGSEEQLELNWVWVYAIITGVILIVSFSRSYLFYMAALRAATQLHHEMLERVLRAPLSFFHTSPTGRILNRFSKDQGTVDEQLSQVFFDCVTALCMVLGAFVLLMIVVPFIIPVFLPLGLAFFWVRRRYVCASREIKRWDAVTRSPVFASFSAILKGLPTIRAYGAGDRFRTAFLRDVSDNGAWWFCFLTSARWIGFRLDTLVALLMTVAPLVIMAAHARVEARLAGLALTQSLQLAGMLQWMVRQSAEVENQMTSVERMLHYTGLEQEPPTLAQGGQPPPKGWPSAGCIQYRDVSAIYREGLPPVLRHLSFTIEGGVSCGVVGRTGSGKSSLMLTLFRLIPVTGGTIGIDGLDTGTVALDALRRQVAIIPQDPVLFSGTLRSNLDPWAAFDDARLWEVLRVAQLGPAVSALGGLDARMQEAGDNLSVGQRQLFCLARALLQDAAILALDEATANVDRTTDAAIQQAVRVCTRGGLGGRRRTLLVIAHRIDTILDCDQLLVLSAGRLVESGPPAELARSGGLFARLVAAARSAGQALPPQARQQLEAPQQQ